MLVMAAFKPCQQPCDAEPHPLLVAKVADQLLVIVLWQKEKTQAGAEAKIEACIRHGQRPTTWGDSREG